MSAPPPKGSRVALYASAAVIQQVGPSDRLESVADQVSLCRLFAESHGWDVVAVYEDPVRSGPPRREGLMRMLHDAARSAFDILLVRDPARLGRDVGFVRQLLNMLGVAGVTVGIVQDPPGFCSDCASAEQGQEVGDE